MTIKIPKAEAVERITALRKLGLPSRAIAERMGLSKSRILAICRDFGIPKWPEGGKGTWPMDTNQPIKM